MHEIKPIIDPLPREELLRELTPDRKVRDTKRAGNEIYIFTAAECPALMREVGRLREIAFRAAGGGTGEEADIDGEDRAEGGYHQLIVWDPAAQEIVGGYRFIVCTSSRISRRNTTSISAIFSGAATCPTPSNWGVRSSSRPIRRAPTRKASMRWTTSGTGSEHSSY